MKDMKQTDKKNRIIYLCAFLLAEIIMVCILKKDGFYPFGTKSMLIMDMKNQYVEFLASLRNIIHGDSSLFFSWSRSMGGNYIGIFAYYVASPLSFLTLFFPVSKMPQAVEFLTILKIGLCSLSFSVYGSYLARKYQGKLSFAVLIPSVCYAFMSYTMVYSLSIMWLDGVIMLPLILMGLEKIFDGARGLQYVICLTLLFISNYYTGYMVGIFTGLYFLIRLVCELTKDDHKKELSVLGRFTGTSLLSIAMAAPILNSAMKDLMSGKLSDVYYGYEPENSVNFAFSGFFTKFLHGKYDSITNTGALPAIYCGFVMLALALVYLVLRQIKWREKIGMLLVLCLFVLSFYFVKLDKVWHGFQYPNWFPYRYAFLFSFVIIYMALRAMIALSTRVWKLGKAPVYIAMAVILAGVSFEMGSNGALMLKGLGDEFGYGEMEEYDTFIKKTQPLVKEIKNKDKGLYRINERYDYSKNDAMLLGYHGMTHYSSTFNANINSLTSRLGLGQAYFWNSGYCATPLLDSVLGCKYTIHDAAMPSCYKAIKSTDEGATGYENTMALPFAYAVDQERTAGDLNQQGIFGNQNEFLNGITGQQNNYFVNCEYSVAQESISVWSYTVTAAADAPMYLYMQAGVSYAQVYVNRNPVSAYFTDESKGALYLGEYKKGDSVYIQVAVNDDGNTYSPSYTELVQLDVNKLSETMTSLQQGGMKVTKSHGGTVAGTITLREDQQEVMTSIPYDEGWAIKVDGKKVEYTKYADTFLQFPCSAGKHKVTMHYVSPGFYTGLLIGLIGLILAVLYLGWDRFIPDPIRKALLKVGSKLVGGRSVQNILLAVLYVVMTVLFAQLYIHMCLNKYSAGMFVRTIFTILVSGAAYWGLGKVNRFLEGKEKWILGVFLGGMLVVQILVGYYMEITPQWDFGSVYNSAVEWAETGDFSSNQEYFYYFNNNLGELGALTLIFKVIRLFGLHQYNTAAMVVNAVLNVLMMLCVYLICKRLLSVKSGFFALFIFLISVPSYMGAAVFYTDVFSMLYPALVLLLYLKLRDAADRKHKVLYGIAMALAAWAGSEIKYTVVIMVIAVIVELLIRYDWKKLCLVLGCTVVVFAACNGIYNADIYHNHLDKETAKQMNTPLLHWVMMSMQGEGGYNAEDYEFNRGFQDTVERDKAIKEKIKERMSGLGTAGMIKLAETKAEKCFSDGTYDYAAFFYHGLARKCFLDKYICSDGEKYESYKKFCTGVFFGFFVLMIIGGGIRACELIRRKREDTSETYRLEVIPQLSVFGLMLFLMMWETNARYIVNFIPMIYVSAAMGMDMLFGKISKYFGNS